jgi:hypothetical protein
MRSEKCLYLRAKLTSFLTSVRATAVAVFLWTSLPRAALPNFIISKKVKWSIKELAKIRG